MARNNFVRWNYCRRVSTELAFAKASCGEDISCECVYLGSRCDLLSSMQQLCIPHGRSLFARIF